MKTFNFSSPETIDETIALLDQHKDSVGIISGGTDFIIEYRNRWRQEDFVVDISKLDDLRYIKEEDNFMHIGARTNFNDLLESSLIRSKYPALYRTAEYMGSPQIRQLGTIGGNIVSASVAGDSPTTFMAYDATVVLQSVNGIREMSLEEFSVDHGKKPCRIENNELLLEVKFPIPNSNQAVGYKKFAKRKSLAIVVLGNSIFIERDHDNKVKDARVFLGAVSLHPIRSTKIEKALIGLPVKQDSLEEVLPLFTEEVVGAIANRPSVVYKKEGIRGLAQDCFRQIIRQFENERI